MTRSHYPIVKKDSSIQESINHLISSRSKVISRFNYLIKVVLSKENICQSSLDSTKLDNSITELYNSMNSYISVIDKKIKLLYKAYRFLCKQSEPMNSSCNRCFNNCYSYDAPHTYQYYNDYDDDYQNQYYSYYNPYYYNQYSGYYDDSYSSYYYPYYFSNYPSSRHYYCSQCWGRS